MRGARGSNGDGGGHGSGRRFSATLMGSKAAILLINQSVMEGRAYRYIYGQAVTRDVRRALMYTVVYQATHRRHPPAEKLNELLQTANECSRPKARNQIKRAA